MTFVFVPGMSDFAFGIVSTFTAEPPRIFFTPSARCVRPELLASWMTIRTFFAPSLLELLAGALARDVLGLADVHHVRRQRVEGAEARVDGDDHDALRRTAFVSGSLSALASGTEVAITFAPRRSRR